MVRLLQRIPLGGLLAGNFLIYMLFWRWFPFFTHALEYPQKDIYTFTPSLPAGFGYVLLLLVSFLFYWLATQKVIAGNLPTRGGVAGILAVSALFCLPLLLTYPINATDIYRYAIHGRVAGVHGQDPYFSPPNDFGDDPYTIFAGEWGEVVSPYGAAWELIAGNSARLLPHNFYAHMLLLKGIITLAYLLIGWFIYQLLSGTPPEQRLGKTALWVWHPALLLIFAVDGHNDSLMLLGLIAGWWLIQNCRREALGITVSWWGVLVKPIGVLAFPFLLLGAWQKTVPAQRIRFVLLSLIGIAVSSGLAFAPFGSPQQLIERLLFEAGDVVGFSPSALLILMGQRAGIPHIYAVLNQTTMWLLLASALGIFGWAWFKNRPICGITNLFGAYLGLALSFRLWYTAWLLPWLIVEEGKSNWRLNAGILLLLTAQLSVFIYGHLWRTILGRDLLWSHLFGVLFTFALPIAIAKFMD